MMLGDHDAFGRDEVRCIEVFKDARELRRLVIRRVKKKEIRHQTPVRNFFQAAKASA